MNQGNHSIPQNSQPQIMLVQIPAVLCSIAVGGCMVLQANLNIGLGNTVGGPIRAACISFCVGYLFISALGLCHLCYEKCWEGKSDEPRDNALELHPYTSTGPSGLRRAHIQDTRHCHHWEWPQYYHCGGLLGAFYILMTVIVIPRLGFSLFYVFVIAGQLVTAIGIDLCAQSSSGREVDTVHPCRYLGCALTLAGATMRMMVYVGKDHNSSLKPWLTGVLASCSLLCGAALPVQAAVNNVLREKMGLTTAGAVRFSFGIGALSLLLLSAISTIFQPANYNGGPDNMWYEWLGGIIGILYLSSGVKFSAIVGYSVFFVCIISGQLGLSLVSDIYGLLGPQRESAASPLSLCGVIGAGLGAAVVSAYSRRSGGAGRESHLPISVSD